MNDYTPIIRNLPLIASVRENQPPGTFVINITADDEDMGYNAAIEIFIDDMVGYTVVYMSFFQPQRHSDLQSKYLLLNI